MIVLDTNILVATLRSRTGSLRVLVRHVLGGRYTAGVSVPLFLEYESVLTRPENLCDFRLSHHDAVGFMNGLANILRPIEITYLWRPQLRDPCDEMVLEAAVNGSATHLLTWNTRDHFPAARRFRLLVLTPMHFLKDKHGDSDNADQ
ncbi:PIN domain-containing protein [Desulfonatronum thioautotrophicum]|uniref:PIN domain-containing protein n=1 Tax=Desulfonatronum thioautotrophicum TaxID=617001 RepID=UPI0005EBB177|nr:PIN domain-containing protein [Desulfonatronum thioautotrophicum]